MKLIVSVVPKIDLDEWMDRMMSADLSPILDH